MCKLVASAQQQYPRTWAYNVDLSLVVRVYRDRVRKCVFFLGGGGVICLCCSYSMLIERIVKSHTMHRSDTVQLCLAEVQLVGRGGLVMDSDPFTAMQV